MMHFIDIKRPSKKQQHVLSDVQSYFSDTKDFYKGTYKMIYTNSAYSAYGTVSLHKKGLDKILPLSFGKRCVPRLWVLEEIHFKVTREEIADCMASYEAQWQSFCKSIQEKVSDFSLKYKGLAIYLHVPCEVYETLLIFGKITCPWKISIDDKMVLALLWGER
jgi:hypothetical protein